MSSADNFCKQFGNRSGPAWSGSKLFDTLIWYSWKNISIRLILNNNQQTTKKGVKNYPACKELSIGVHTSIRLSFLQCMFHLLSNKRPSEVSDCYHQLKNGSVLTSVQHIYCMLAHSPYEFSITPQIWSNLWHQLRPAVVDWFNVYSHTKSLLLLNWEINYSELSSKYGLLS